MSKAEGGGMWILELALLGGKWINLGRAFLGGPAGRRELWFNEIQTGSMYKLQQFFQIVAAFNAYLIELSKILRIWNINDESWTKVKLEVKILLESDSRKN